MGSLRFERVAKAFGSTQALRGVTFEVPKRCIAGLVGPNGAGKTTTLRIAVGAIRRDYGEVDVLGYDPWEEPDKVRALVGFLPEAPQFPPVKVSHLLMHVARLKVGSDAIREVRRVARLAGIYSILDRRADKLSAGFRQRVALALALVGEPKLLLLDEPASNLDPIAREELFNLLRSLKSDYGVDILVSTHVLAEAQYLVDYLIVISKGMVVAEGWISELTKEVGGVVKATFRARKGVDVKSVVKEILEKFKVEGVSVKGAEISVEIKHELYDEVREFLERKGLEVTEEKTSDLTDLYRRLVGA